MHLHCYIGITEAIGIHGYQVCGLLDCREERQSEKRMQSSSLVTLTFHLEIVALELDEEQQLATHLTDVGPAHGRHLLLALMMHIQIAVCQGLEGEGSYHSNSFSHHLPLLTYSHT